MEDYREVACGTTIGADPPDLVAPEPDGSHQSANDAQSNQFEVTSTLDYKTALVDGAIMALVYSAAEASTARRRARTGDSSRDAGLSTAALGLRLVTIIRAQARTEDCYTSVRTLARYAATKPRMIRRAAAWLREEGLLLHEDLSDPDDDDRNYRWRVEHMPCAADVRRRAAAATWIPIPLQALFDPRLRPLDIWVLTVLCDQADYQLACGTGRPDPRRRILTPIKTLDRDELRTASSMSALGDDAWRAALRRLIAARYLRRQQGGIRILPPVLTLGDATRGAWVLVQLADERDDKRPSSSFRDTP